MRLGLTICGELVGCDRLSSYVFGDFVSLVLPVHQCFELFEEFSVMLV